MKTPIVMCNWKRTENIAQTLAMLEGQTTHNFDLYIWNNNTDDRKKLDTIVSMYKLSYNIEVHHSRENVGGIGRFYFSRDIAKKGYDGPVIFIDDDVQFGSDMVETFIEEYSDDKITSFYAHNIQDNSYWNKTLEPSPGKNVDYCGTGGMVSPISLFKNEKLYSEFPLMFHFIEDLWLSYFFKYKCNGKLQRSENEFILMTDSLDQSVNADFRKLKETFLSYLVDKFINKGQKLLIKFPTRGRSYKFFDVLDLYVDYLHDKDNYEIIVSCDDDDTDMNRPEIIERLKTYKNLKYYFGKNDTKIQAVNSDMEGSEFDIVLLASDDMIPQKRGYDNIIRKDMVNTFEDGDGVLWYFDGYNRKTDTLSIMGKKYYDRFGYMYHPDYITFWADNEFQEVATRLKRIKFFDNVIIKHEHPDNNQQVTNDSTYQKNAISGDHAIYNRREAKNFDL
jgi:hypothetical protein